MSNPSDNGSQTDGSQPDGSQLDKAQPASWLVDSENDFWPTHDMLRCLSGLEVKLYLFLVIETQASGRGSVYGEVVLPTPTTAEISEHLGASKTMVSRAMRALVASTLVKPPGEVEQPGSDAKSGPRPTPLMAVLPVGYFTPAAEEPSEPLFESPPASEASSSSRETAESAGTQGNNNIATSISSDWNNQEEDGSASGTTEDSPADAGSEGAAAHNLTGHLEECEATDEAGEDNAERERTRERNRRYRQNSKAFYDDLEANKPEVKKCLDILHTVEGWPTGYDKDRRSAEYLEGYIEKWPATDPVKVCEHFSSYYAHKGVGGKRSSPIGKLRTFFDNEQKYSKAQRDTSEGRVSISGRKASPVYGVREREAQRPASSYFTHGGSRREQKPADGENSGDADADHRMGDSGEHRPAEPSPSENDDKQ